MKRKVLVTGANGFIGQHLVSYLASRGYDVHALLRPGSLPSFLLGNNITVHYGDVRDEASLSESIPTDAYVINLAAVPYHKTLGYLVNVVGTQKLLAVAGKKRCRKFIHISTQATKIPIKGVYGSTKEQSDALVRSSGIPYVIIKPSLVYGPGEKGLFSKVFRLAAKLPIIPVFGNGKTPLYPIHVHDLCVLLEHVIRDETLSGETFDAGGSDRVTYNTLYETIAQYLPRKPKLLHVPKTIGLLMARAFSILPNPPFYKDNVLGSTQDTRCNPKPLLRRHNYTPKKFNKAVKEIFAPKRIRIGIIGLGKMGMLHTTLLRMIPQAEIAALIDTNPKLFSTFASMGIRGKFYPSLSDALKHEKLDAVYITTPTFVHVQLLKEALRHNLHAFVEKPVALNSKQLIELSSIQPKTVVHAGYTLLYHRPFQELQRIINDRRFGSVRSYSASFKHGEVLAPKKGWMYTKSLSGGGVLMNPGPHLFSLLHACFGKPKAVMGILKKIYSEEVEDEAHFTFTHPSYTGKASLSWSVPKKNVTDYRISCVFEKAQVTATPQGITIQKGRSRKIVPFEQLPTQEPNAFTINPNAYGEAYYLENLVFIRAIQGLKDTVPNSLNAALQTEQLIQNCYKKGSLE